MIGVVISNIQWDLDDCEGPPPGLPRDCVLFLDDGDGEIDEEAVSEALTAKYAFCHTGFSYYVRKPMVQQCGD